MGTPTASNILKTGATLYYAPVGEALPDETTVALGAAWGGNWERVGYTEDGVTLGYSDTRHRVEVEESLIAVKEVRIAEEMVVETTLAETTAEYLVLLIGGGAVSTTAAGASQKAYEQVGLGNEGTPQEYSIGLEGTFVAADGVEHPVRWFFDRVTLSLGGEMKYSRRSADHTTLPFRAAVLAPVTAGFSGRPFIFQRVTAPASS